MLLNKNDKVEIDIDSCGLDGSGVGRYEGMAVFVRCAIPGEKIRTHIIKAKKNYAAGKIEEILVPSPDRIESPCPVYGRCGGCSFGHMKYEAEIRAKENHVKECFRRIGGLSPEFEETLAAKEIYGYRNKAQFPVRKDGDKLLMGFYSPRTHRVIHCPGCLLQPPEFEKILGVFENYINEFNVPVYDEESGKGLIRHIYLRKGTASGEIAVCPVINGKSLPAEDELVKMLTACCESIKTVVINENPENTNVVTGEKCRTVYGPGYITDTLCGLEFRLSPLSFYQVNRDQAERLYGKAAEYACLTGKETVLDLYCGTGTIGLTMAKNAGQIIGVEVIPEAIEDAGINAKTNGIENARFICADASKAAEELKAEGIKPDVVILDPPRKGCAREVLETVAEMKPERIVYVSCDPATLARDCGIFRELGYETVKAAACDMFPRTGHCETVACLTRSFASR